MRHLQLDHQLVVQTFHFGFSVPLAKTGSKAKFIVTGRQPSNAGFHKYCTEFTLDLQSHNSELL